MAEFNGIAVIAPGYSLIRRIASDEPTTMTLCSAGHGRTTDCLPFSLSGRTVPVRLAWPGH